MKKSRKLVKKSRKPMKKSRKAIKKSRKAIKKSRKPMKKSRKPMKKSRKPMKKSRKAMKKSRKRRSRKRSRKKQSRSRKNKFKMKTMEPWWKSLLSRSLLYQGGLPGDKRGRAAQKLVEAKRRDAEAISPLIATLPPHLIYEILKKNAPGDVLPVGSVLGPNSAIMRKLRKRMNKLKAFQRMVRDDQKLQIALPGYPKNTRTSRIENLFEFLSQKKLKYLTPEQIHEVRRLVANAYTTRDGGYSDAELFGTGRMANTWQFDDPEDRKAFRRNLLAGAPLTARVIGSERLPLSLEILRKGRRFNDVIPSDRYPRDADGNIDETHDIFWPKTRNEMNKFLRMYPTNKEISYFGY